MPELVDENQYQSQLNSGSIKIRKKSVTSRNNSVIESGNTSQTFYGNNETKLLVDEGLNNNPAMSGIQIAKNLNLPNYDITLEDVNLIPKLVGLGRI
jgi:hypothetical protein